MAKRRIFTVILEPEESGGFVVHCPALPGCISQGDTRQETLDNIKEAILLVLDVMSEQGQSVLPETPEVVSQEIAEILKIRDEDGLPLIVETAQVELPSTVPA
ncbi:MAG: type II toxin-antitoxin system HicB family antitoxin [SAR202 cluster bacterium]|nr:type II toxin-antitoxin system HicB family antitoxin [SAR202 cluster bacterium]